ncbi:phospholipase C/P1 nuclease domain-containing protein [Vararia minispora EC-137]|uniref:Phospholipase C/P1 nuclease domain-containing protein n=1 Tax=Vararia minispora EC-137 TaxID=1314806 RepID=A0ACB8QER1_9AGAM|nr:phospholipase C/P1 nuclease domain-containing protein [Vararia minispora EC-137]
MRLVLALTALVSALPVAYAWGAAGHEIVATIAQMHLQPPVMRHLCAVLSSDADFDRTRPCTLAAIAPWADKIRMHARWSAALHYIGARDDHPPDSCAFPGARGWAGHEDINVLHAIRNVTGILDGFVARGGVRRASAKEMATASEALKFLVHFVGDMHQPLHLTGRDRGGNGDKVAWNGRVTNLHSLWDSLLIAKALRTIPRNYTRPLPVPPMEAVLKGTIYDPYVRRIMYEGVGLGAYSTVRGRWEDEVEAWLDCPAPPMQSFLQRPLQAAFGVGARSETDDGRICPHAWAAPIHKLNCDFIWPRELDDPAYPHMHAVDAENELRDAMEDYGRRGRSGGHYLELDTPEYAGAIAERWVVEKLLAQGGIRLAGILNDIFMPLTAHNNND